MLEPACSVTQSQERTLRNFGETSSDYYILPQGHVRDFQRYIEPTIDLLTSLSCPLRNTYFLMDSLEPIVAT